MWFASKGEKRWSGLSPSRWDSALSPSPSTSRRNERDHYKAVWEYCNIQQGDYLTSPWEAHFLCGGRERRTCGREGESEADKNPRVDREEVSPFLVLKEVFKGRNEYLYKDSKSKGDRHSI